MTESSKIIILISLLSPIAIWFVALCHCMTTYPFPAKVITTSVKVSCWIVVLPILFPRWVYRKWEKRQKSTIICRNCHRKIPVDNWFHASPTQLTVKRCPKCDNLQCILRLALAPLAGNRFEGNSREEWT